MNIYIREGKFPHIKGARNNKAENTLQLSSFHHIISKDIESRHQTPSVFSKNNKASKHLKQTFR